MSRSGIDFDRQLQDALDNSELAQMGKRVFAAIKEISEVEKKLLGVSREELFNTLGLDEGTNDEQVIEAVLSYIKKEEYKLLVQHCLVSNVMMSACNGFDTVE